MPRFRSWLRRQLTDMLGLRVVRFGLVGVANTTIDYGIFAGLMLGAGAPLLLAQGAGIGVAAAFSFFANRSFTFRATHAGARGFGAFLRFLSANAVALGVATLVLALLATIGVDVLLAKAVSILASMSINFILLSGFVFRTRPEVAANPSL